MSSVTVCISKENWVKLAFTSSPDAQVLVKLVKSVYFINKFYTFSFIALTNESDRLDFHFYLELTSS